MLLIKTNAKVIVHLQGPQPKGLYKLNKKPRSPNKNSIEFYENAKLISATCQEALLKFANTVSIFYIQLQSTIVIPK